MTALRLALLALMLAAPACSAMPPSDAPDDPRAGPLVGPGNPKSRGIGQ
jgi:hypothetical protein